MALDTVSSHSTALCSHCGEACAEGERFCCHGCAAAYDLIRGLGLQSYYQRRLLDPSVRSLRPDPQLSFDLTPHITPHPDGSQELMLTVDGIQCGACVWLIEQVLSRAEDVVLARLNMTTCRLRLLWRGEAGKAQHYVEMVEQLGYRLVPFDPSQAQTRTDAQSQALMRALAVAGFAAGNVMLLSIGIWAGVNNGMGPATRTLLHWVSALIALPAIVYAGQPFFRSAWNAVRHHRTNMDVPISVGVVLVSSLSLWQTLQGGVDTYFDSAVTLLFFLLIGRVLDHRARGQASATAERMLALRSIDVAVLLPDGTVVRRNQQSVAPGDAVLVAMGEKIGVDGRITHGKTHLDTSLVTGESLPEPAGEGALVYAGTINLGEAITIAATATGTGTLLAEMVRLIEAAEGRRGRYVVLADRVARLYAPAVHLCALFTFLGWVFLMHAPISQSLLIACAALIITCPCALALAVPVSQVIATGALFEHGILLKSGTALERLADIDTVVFDKTGTLTSPTLALLGSVETDQLKRAARLATRSHHPLARALVAACGPVQPAEGVIEHPGLGLSLPGPDGEVRLGSAVFCGVESSNDARAELWLRTEQGHCTHFAFTETLRPDAASTLATLRHLGLTVRLLSGDRPASVGAIAQALEISDWQARMRPEQKMAEIEALQRAGHKVLMVGDGLNDGPCLAAASVSMSPASAVDLSQTIADLVFQGRSLRPVAETIVKARHTQSIMRQNLTLALGYNVLVLPMAVAGWVTPWAAAAAMSLSSLMVMTNALRLRCGRAK